LKLLIKSTQMLLATVFLLNLAACAEAPDSSNINATSPSTENNQSQDLKTNANIDTMTDAQVNAWLEEEAGDDKVVFKIGERELSVEYADSPDERALGLMHRRTLCEDCGMLFKFDSSRVGSIWMKNTFIPLDLAYISAEGKIVDIIQLQPHDLTPVRSSLLVLYALEMNEGWFATHDIKEGDKVTLLP